MIKKMNSSFVAGNVRFLGNAMIGHFCVLGNENEADVQLGNNLALGDYCKIAHGVVLGENAVIGDYCAIFRNNKIGNNLRLIMGSKIMPDCIIGDDVIINGQVARRTIIEDGVRFFGRIAHSHRDHYLPWTTTSEPSPVFKKGCIVGVNALIIGDLTIGENAYVAAGEIVRCDVPPNSLFYRGQILEKSKMRGFIL